MHDNRFCFLEKIEISQPGSVTETEGKQVDGKSGQPFINPLPEEDQPINEQRQEGNMGLDISASIPASQPSSHAGTSELSPASSSETKDAPALAPAQTVLLNTRLRYGTISNRPEDIVYWKPDWLVPDYITESLLRQHSNVSVADLVILSGEKGELKCQVHQGHQLSDLAAGEIIKLKTCMYCGQISYESKDVEIFDKTFRVPDEVANILKRDYRMTPLAKLLVVSDSKDNLRLELSIKRLVS